MEQTVTSSTNKGIVISSVLIVIVIALISYFLNMNTSSWLQYVSYAVFVIGIIWSVNLYGKQIDHNSTFGNYFAHGFKIAAIVTVIMIVYIVIFVYLFPDIREKAIDAARKECKISGEIDPGAN